MERNQLTRVRPVEKKKTSFTKGLKIIYFNNHRLPQSKAFRAHLRPDSSEKFISITFKSTNCFLALSYFQV